MGLLTMSQIGPRLGVLTISQIAPRLEQARPGPFMAADQRRGSAPPLRPRSRAGPPALTAPRAQIRAQPPRPLIGGGGRNLRARPSRAGERGVTKSRHYQAVLRQAAEGLGDARAPLCGARWFGPPVGGLRGRWAEAGRAEAELRRNGRTQ